MHACRLVKGSSFLSSRSEAALFADNGTGLGGIRIMDLYGAKVCGDLKYSSAVARSGCKALGMSSPADSCRTIGQVWQGGIWLPEPQERGC